MFANEAVPLAARHISEVPARFGARFRPALLCVPLGRARQDVPYVAVWPDEGALPDLSEDAVAASDDLAGVVLAELADYRCFVCDAGFEVIQPEVAIPVLGRNLARHRIVSGCPVCGSAFGKSRIDGLALLPRL
ncbi:hypothetical protein ACIBL8_43945 [Streptomyces sp. NPDC050523]|uniref:hypothetical protein n=1 Tax=Streptomyces sp. NPDC050523 TaxID=3365622 RepID=UPI0037A41EDF